MGATVASHAGLPGLSVRLAELGQRPRGQNPLMRVPVVAHRKQRWTETEGRPAKIQVPKIAGDDIGVEQQRWIGRGDEVRV